MFSTRAFCTDLDQMRHRLAALEVDSLAGDQAATIVEKLTSLISAAEAARSSCARRAQATSVHKREGHRSAADWLAHKSGTSLSQARAELHTAQLIDALPGVDAAFRSGDISAHQACALAKAASVVPSAESTLVAAARHSTLKELKTQCRRVEASAAAAEAARHAALHHARFLRHWVDDSGAVRFTGQLAPDDGARVIAAIDAAASRHFQAARKAGRREATQCYAADAFVELITSPSATSSPGPSALVHVTVDRTSLQRGYVEGDEHCTITGVGPVPVATAKALMTDCILKVLVTKGADVCTVAGIGRTIPSAVRSALVQRDRTCVVPHCDVQYGLEIDHIVPFADGGPSALTNLCRLCKYHHSMKTHRGFTIRGRPGEWAWVPPP